MILVEGRSLIHECGDIIWPDDGKLHLFGCQELTYCINCGLPKCSECDLEIQSDGSVILYDCGRFRKEN